MKGKSKAKFKQMQKCCEELTDIARQTTSNQNDLISAIKLLEANQVHYDRRYEDHEEKEDKKNKWIYDKFEELNEKFNKLNNRIYLAMGGGAVLLVLFKYLNLGITITQGGG